MPRPIHFAIGQEFLDLDGLGEKVAHWEDGQRAPTTPGTYEWWYFDAHFDDGTTAVIVYATKPIYNPYTSLLPNLSLTITRPDGRKTAEFALPLPAEFSAAKETCNLKMGSAWARQEIKDERWSYSLHAETRTQSADLNFTGLVPLWRPGAGKCYFGGMERYFAWLPAIPHGTVTGTLTCDGQTRQVAGTGYHDHNWGNIALPTVLDHWTWGRAHVGEYSLIFVEQVAAKHYGSASIPVFLLVRGESVLADDARCLVMANREFIRHSSGRDYPPLHRFLVYSREGKYPLVAARAKTY